MISLSFLWYILYFIKKSHNNCKIVINLIFIFLTDHFKLWLEELTFQTLVLITLVLLIDSWIRYCPNIISDLTFAGKHIIIVL